MSETKEQPDTIHITMTRRAAEFYALFVASLGGEILGPRREIATAVGDQLEAQGIEFWKLPKCLTLQSYFRADETFDLPHLAKGWPEGSHE